MLSSADAPPAAAASLRTGKVAPASAQVWYVWYLTPYWCNSFLGVAAPLRCQRVRARKRERANNGIRDALQGAIAAVPAVETPEPESETSESWSAASREGGQRSAAECMTAQPAEGPTKRRMERHRVALCC